MIETKIGVRPIGALPKQCAIAKVDMEIEVQNSSRTGRGDRVLTEAQLVDIREYRKKELALLEVERKFFRG